MTQRIIAIVAMAKNRAIGFENKLPWMFAADLKRFKRITMGWPLIMGRRTFESIGKPLPGRKNIVVSKQLPYGSGLDIVTSTSLKDAIHRAGASEKIFVIGGAQIYAQCFAQNLVTDIDITVLDLEPNADAFFPEFEAQFSLTNEESGNSGEMAFKIQQWVHY